MQKLIYLLFREPEHEAEGFARAMREEVAERLLDVSDGLTLNLVDSAIDFVPQSARRTRLSPPPDGAASVWIESDADRERVERTLRSVCRRFVPYRVKEHIEIPNRRASGEAGRRVPGVNVVALLERPDFVNREDWLRHWAEHHVPVAEETQSTYAYVRNIVLERLGDEGPGLAGIVEEGFPDEALVDPMVWYAADGDRALLKARFARMMKSVTAFLEPEKVESHPMSEYRWERGA